MSDDESNTEKEQEIIDEIHKSNFMDMDRKEVLQALSKLNFRGDSVATDRQAKIGTVDTKSFNVDLTAIDYEELNIKGAVPVEELEALADEWETASTDENLKPPAVGAMTACADELREVLEQYD